MTASSTNLLELTAQIASAHCANNQVATDTLPALIHQIYQALVDAPTGRSSDQPVPAVPIKRSVFPDYIVCLEDGRKLKILKRHLKAAYDMTPEQYRERWGLPPEYPMVAPNYAERRSELARKVGLGVKSSLES